MAWKGSLSKQTSPFIEHNFAEKRPVYLVLGSREGLGIKE